MASPDYDAEVELVFFAQQPRGTELLRLVEVEQRLRDPDGGCPWDLEQDHSSLRPYLLEEVYELLEAIDSGSDLAIREELGDVLLQVVFHAQIASDRGTFTIDDVARAITEKLVNRHPHVFGDVEVADAAEVKRNWDELKQAEKGRRGPFEGVPEALPALVLAEKLQRRAAKLGFDWREASEPAARVREELDELADAADRASREEELGDLLGAVVGLARHLDLDAEQALRRAAAKFRRRFEAVHAAAEQDPGAAEGLDRGAWLALWDQVKVEEG
ncbi:MAG: nucleoside triphosphate pyrophosphohydrolase [Actinobacteria bacterium]|nr:nucleoside triphosphate pyrophosphohydrolase [Actinomycetota bacterium]